MSVNTVERALSELRDEGVVETFHGLGSFVRTAPEPEPANDEIEEIRERLARLETQMEEVYANLILHHPSESSDTATQEAG